jgi:hypothetical protein
VERVTRRRNDPDDLRAEVGEHATSTSGRLTPEFDDSYPPEEQLGSSEEQLGSSEEQLGSSEERLGSRQERRSIDDCGWVRSL